MTDPSISPGGDDVDESRTRKRKRVPVACGPCRLRKTRCDGQRPKCSTCNELDLDCQYAATQPGGKEGPIPKVYLDLVEARFSLLERELAEIKSQQQQQAAAARSIATEHGSATSGSQAALGADSGASGTYDEHLDSDRTPDATDGVGTVEFSGDETRTYFGPSSNIAFTRIVRETLGKLLHRTRTQAHAQYGFRPHDYERTLAISRPPSPKRTFSLSWTAKMDDALGLPSEPEVKLLANHFFSETGMLFPYINEGHFWSSYRAIKASPTANVSHSSLGVLNMVFAMATSTGGSSASTAEARFAKSEMFFDRAKTLCLDRMIAGPSVESVQAMLLITQYLQGTQRSVKTWAIHGLAVKAAFELGLHSPMALQRHTGLAREIRLRTWYGCVVLDRTLSMTFGRPPVIPDYLVRTVLPSHQIENPTLGASVWSFDQNSTLFWVSTIELYAINAEIIRELYGSNVSDINSPPMSSIASTIFQIEQQLFKWQACLPAELPLVRSSAINTSTEIDVRQFKFRVILTLRYHNLRILAHRPVLDRALLYIVHAAQPADQGVALNQIRHLSLSACLDSAQAIISITNVCLQCRSENQASDFLGAWWFTLYYTLNAALVVAALVMIKQSTPASSLQLNELTVEELDAILGDAVSIIQKLDIGNKMLDKCSRFLSTLRDLVSGCQYDQQGVLPQDAEPASSVMNETVDQFAREPFTSIQRSLSFEPFLDDDSTGYGELFLPEGLVEMMAPQEDIFW